MAPVAPRFGDAIFSNLMRVGLYIGIRLVDEFLAKSNVLRCVDFKESVEVIAKVSMKTEVTWVRDMLRSDDVFELQVKLLKQIPEEYPYMDDE